MTIGNRFELIDDQLYISQGILNVYWYKQIAGGAAAAAADLVSAFLVNLLPLVEDIQDDNLQHIFLRARNVDDPTDFSILPLAGEFGNWATADQAPSFIAAAFRLNRTTQASRHGWKRYAGVPRNNIQNNDAIAAYLPSLNALAAGLDNDWLGVAGNVYRPVIVRRVTDPVTGIVTYTDFPMGLAAYVRITTQNTRKP